MAGVLSGEQGNPHLVIMKNFGEYGTFEVFMELPSLGNNKNLSPARIHLLSKP